MIKVLICYEVNPVKELRLPITGHAFANLKDFTEKAIHETLLDLKKYAVDHFESQTRLKIEWGPIILRSITKLDG